MNARCLIVVIRMQMHESAHASAGAEVYVFSFHMHMSMSVIKYMNTPRVHLHQHVFDLRDCAYTSACADTWSMRIYSSMHTSMCIYIFSCTHLYVIFDTMYMFVQACLWHIGFPSDP